MTPEEAAEIQATGLVRLAKKFADLETQFSTAIQALQFIAAHITSKEGDEDATDDIRMAHDNMIYRASSTLDLLNIKINQ